MENTNIVIAVVGVGAVGASLIAQLVTCIRDTGICGIQIIAFERNKQFGPGVAYQPDGDFAILNRTAANMSAFGTRRDHFTDWLIAEGYGHASHQDYLPRSLFGRYLEATVESAARQAAAAGNEVVLVRDWVTRVEGVAGAYRVHCGQRSWSADTVVLCTGNLISSRYRHLVGTRNYFHSPYPLDRTMRKIGSRQSVAVIGSRLSAVDVLVGLEHSGFLGPVSLLSREGYLPSVQSAQEKASLKYCTRERIQRLSKIYDGRLHYTTVLRLVLKELSCACGYRFSAKNQKPRDSSSFELFRQDTLRAMDGAQPWQSAFVALNEVISDLWNLLSDSDREKFIRLDFSRFMALRVPIPVRNAVKVIELFDSGRLQIHQRLKNIVFRSGKFLATFNGGYSPRTYDAVINCASSDNDLTRTHDSLYSQLASDGLVVPHPFGGVVVDFETNLAKSRKGDLNEGMYVVGNMTSGTYLFCSVLEINARHCHRISLRIADQIARQKSGVFDEFLAQ